MNSCRFAVGLTLSAAILLTTSDTAKANLTLASPLGDCDGSNCPTPYPNTGTYANIQGRDNSYAVFIGGNLTITNAAEAEGGVFVGGDFNLNKTGGVYNTGWVGVGSFVVPDTGEDYLTVGGDVNIPNGATLEIGGLTTTGGDPIVGNLRHKGSIPGSGINTSGSIISDPGLNLGAFQTEITNAQSKSQCFANLNQSSNVTFTDEGWRVVISSTDGASGTYVVNINQDIAGQFGAIGLEFANFPDDATILINVTDTGGDNQARLNLNDITRNGASIGSFTVSANDRTFREQIFWNFPDSVSAVSFEGFAQFQGSVLVANAASETTVDVPGMNGRFLSAGNVMHTKGGSEFHNYPFRGTLPTDCSTPSPEPDTDGDGIPDSKEGTGDRDGDGVPNNQDFDPQGYFYDEATGQIIPGGSISVVPPAGGVVNLIDDGNASGFYQWIGSVQAGTYTMVVTPPPGYALSSTCLSSDPPAFDPTGGADPLALGAGENGTTGTLMSSDCASNTFYLSFDLGPGDPLIINNNLPLTRNLSLDYGDAPNTYGTNDASGGPSHTIVSGIHLGTAPDSESDAETPLDGSGDGAEDDGIALSGSSLQGQSLTVGDTLTLDITALGAGVLNAWIDWDGDGTFNNATENIADNADVSGGTLSVTVPNNATVGNTYARFRYSSDTDLGPTGAASDGEVEDYAVAIAPATSSATPQICPSGSGVYATWATTSGSNGTGTFLPLAPNVAVMPNYTWSITGERSFVIDSSEDFSGGNSLEPIYGEADNASNLNVRNEPNIGVEGDPIDSRSIVTITFDRPTPASGWAFSTIDLDVDQVSIRATDASGNPVPLATIDSWFVEAFDADPVEDGPGDIPIWDRDDAALVGSRVPSGEYTNLIENTIGDTEAGAAWFQPNISLSALTLQFDTKDEGSGTPSFHAYLASCVTLPSDYGDAPDSYGTDATDDSGEGIGPSHRIVNGIHLGATAPDAETDAATPLDGTGDGGEDDGVTLPASLEQGATISLPVTTTGTGVLNAWIDWNGDGVFDNATESVATDANVSGGTLSVTVPANATVGNTYARFRYSSQTGLTPGGAASDGEVEDYAVAIASAPVSTGPTFQCDGEFYIAIGNKTTPDQQLYHLDRSTDPYTFNSIGNPTNNTFYSQGFTYNGLALNINDGYMYGIIERTTGSPYDLSSIIRIDASGDVTTLGVPQPAGGNPDNTVTLPGETLPEGHTTTRVTYSGGTFLPDGTYVFVTDIDSSIGRISEVYTVDINTSPPTVTRQGILNGHFLNDLIVNPLDPTLNRLYAISENADRLLYIDVTNPTAGGTNATSAGTGVSINYGSQFMDAFGTVYFRSATTSSLYRLDATGAAQLITSAPTGGNHDGTSCQGIDITKNVSTTDPVPAGENVTYTYQVANASTSPVTMTFSDDLRSVSDQSGTADDEGAAPVNGTYTGTGNITLTNATGTPVLSNNDQTLIISDLTIPSQTVATITAQVTIPLGATPDTYYNQAVLSSLPPIYPATLLSDYFPGTIFREPTPVEVIEPVATDPNVLLVKRITAINGATTNPNDSTNLTGVVNDGTANSPDDEGNWPDNYLLGSLDAGLVKPGDQIEYTVYFLNAGNSDAENVRICDWIQPNQSLVTGLYNESSPGTRDGNDIELSIGGTTYQLTTANDTADRAVLTTVGDLGSLAPTLNCNLSAGASTSDSVLVLDITGTTGDPTGLTTLPGTTGQGSPSNAYGFFRFTTQVDE